jgi:hypothetical protein
MFTVYSQDSISKSWWQISQYIRSSTSFVLQTRQTQKSIPICGAFVLFAYLNDINILIKFVIQIICQLCFVESYNKLQLAISVTSINQRFANNFYSNFYLMYRCNVIYNLNLIGFLLRIYRRHHVKELFWLS